MRRLRAELWREHLGPEFQTGERPVEGWLPLWRAVAARNAETLGRPSPVPWLDGAFVLPYSTRSTPTAQLADIGVVLAPEAIELCFEPSWLEVHFSPYWVRNMFA